MKKTNYHAIDIIKFLCAVLVIMVHTAPLLPYNAKANWFLMTIMGRFVVPFFFISTGYFICKNTQERGEWYFKSYIRSLIKIYLIWSLVYLPCGIEYIGKEFDIPLFLYPVALLVALVYVGTYFHLWYIPALILALLLVHWFMKHFKKRYLLTLSFICFLLGSLETYYGFIHIPLIRDLIDHYINIFFTTRNGLFFGFFYVAWGYFIAQKDTWLQRIHHHGWLTLLFFILMNVEAFIIYDSNNLDSNILLMAAPFTICLFLYAKSLNITWKLPYRKLREYSSIYYFAHAYFLILIPMFLSLFQLQWLFDNHGVFRFFSVLLCTHLVSLAIYHMQIKFQKKREMNITTHKNV